MSPCAVTHLADGTVVHLCGAGIKRPPRCSAWDCKAESEFLCDWPMHDGRTCDAKLCRAHALEVESNRHVCPFHQARPWPPAGRPKLQLQLFPE